MNVLRGEYDWTVEPRRGHSGDACCPELRFAGTHGACWNTGRRRQHQRRDRHDTTNAIWPRPGVTGPTRRLRPREHPAAVLTEFLQAVASNPDDAEAHLRLGQVLANLERPGDAIAYFEAAVAIDPLHAGYRAQLAQTLGALAEWRRAVAEYRAAAASSPAEPSIHYGLGRALHKIGNDQEAIEAYSAAVAVNPDDPAVYLSMGVSYEALRQWEVEVSAYRRYLDLTPAGPQTTALKWHVVARLENREPARAGT